MWHSIMCFLRPVFFLLLAIESTALAQPTGWQSEQIVLGSANSFGDGRIAFENKTGRAIAAWEPVLAGSYFGAGFAVRSHQGSVTARQGPSDGQRMQFYFDDAGNGLFGWRSAAGIFTGYLPAGSTGPLTNQQNLGLTIPYATDSAVDVHISANGNGAVIWLDKDGQVKVALRPQGDNAQFDVATAFTLDTKPTSSSGGLFVTCETDGTVFALWRKDGTYKQSIYSPVSKTFSNPVVMNLAVNVGPPPHSFSVAIGSVQAWSIAKNPFGEAAIAYSIHTLLAAPQSSFSQAAAYRKKGQLFGPHTLYPSPYNQDYIAAQAALMRDGTAYAAWYRNVMVTNTCTSGIGGALRTDGNEIEVKRFDPTANNGVGSWNGFAFLSSGSGGLSFFTFPFSLALADGRVVVGAGKFTKDTVCSGSAKNIRYFVSPLLWPTGAPSIGAIGSINEIPGMPGVTDSQVRNFGSIAGLAVSNTGVISVLGMGKNPTASNNTASIFTWESGVTLAPTETPTPIPSPTPGSGTGVTAGTLSFAASSTALDKKGLIPVKIKCKGAAGGECAKGKVNIYRLKKVKGKSTKEILASATFKAIKNGNDATVSLKRSKLGKSAFSAKKTSVYIEFVVTGIQSTKNIKFSVKKS